MQMEGQAQGAETLEPGQEPNAQQPGTEAEPGGQNEGAEGGEPPNGEDSPYAPLAKEMGWVPKDQFSGPESDWKDPETFIRAGRDIQRETSRELKSVRQQLDAIARTNASIVEQQVSERVAELTAAHAKAVEDGDPQTAFRISNDIVTLQSKVSQPAPQASPEAQAFAERNATWFNQPGHEFATARAIEICNTLAGQGYNDHGTQLRIAEQRLRQEMPELFGGAGARNGKPAAAVNSPASRTSGASSRPKGFPDMPKAAQDIALDMERRGVIKSKDDYAKKYFENQAARG